MLPIWETLRTPVFEVSSSRGERGFLNLVLTHARFTDFLVNEISLAGDIVHLVDIGLPSDPQTETSNAATAITEMPKISSVEEQPESTKDSTSEELPDLPPQMQFADRPVWPSSITSTLRAHFSDETVIALHELLLDGKDVRPQQDGGWGSRPARSGPAATEEEMAMNMESSSGQGRDRGRGRGNARGGRGGRSDGQWKPEDKREVVSQVSFVSGSY